ncbi:hypothetical protein TWF281_005698 [Arthrobotrys megalospora]
MPLQSTLITSFLVLQTCLSAVPAVNAFPNARRVETNRPGNAGILDKLGLRSVPEPSILPRFHTLQTSRNSYGGTSDGKTRYRLRPCPSGKICCGDYCILEGSDCCLDLGETTFPHLCLVTGLFGSGIGSVEDHSKTSDTVYPTTRPTNRTVTWLRDPSTTAESTIPHTVVTTKTGSSKTKWLWKTWTKTVYDTYYMTDTVTKIKTVVPYEVYSSTIFWTYYTKFYVYDYESSKVKTSTSPVETSRVITVLATGYLGAERLLRETSNAIITTSEQTTTMFHGPRPTNIQGFSDLGYPIETSSPAVEDDYLVNVD